MPDAIEEQSQAQARAGEPIKSRSGGKSTSMDSEAKSLGSSFLSGIGQELGFPDIFGKSPAEFGITKLFGGFAKYLFGTLNALGDAGGHFGGDQTPQGIGPNLAAGMAQPFGIPAVAFNPVARAPMPQFPGGPNAPMFPGPSGPAPGPAQTPTPQAPGDNGPTADYPKWYGSGKPAAAGTPQIPAGAPGSIVPPAPGQTPGPTSPTPQTVPADFRSSSDKNYGKRYAPGFDGQPTPQGFPGASLFSQITTDALNIGGNILNQATSAATGRGKPDQFSVGGNGGGGGQDSSTPLGATGLQANQVAGTVTNYTGDAVHNYGDTHHHYHVDNSKTWNIAPKSDSTTVQHLREHDNAQRDNAALASAPGTLMSYP